MLRLLARRSALAIAPLVISCGDAPTSDGGANGPPTVVTTSPAPGAIAVGRTVALTATFSEPIRVTASAVEVTSFRGTVRGTVQATGSTLTYSPESPLAMGTAYTARLTTAIRDLDGAPLAEAYSWTFTTEDHTVPELVSSQVAVGMAVEHETIQADGDVDTFYLTGEAGAEWVVFVQSGPERFSSVHLTLHDSASGAVLAQTTTPENFPELEAWSTGRLILPRTGGYIIRVTGRAPATYRFRVDAVIRAPELAPSRIAVGDTVAEAIGTVADIDEFTFEARAETEVNVAFQLQSGVARSLTLEVLHAGRIIRKIETGVPTGSLDDFGTGRMTLPFTGPYTVRVYGPAYGPKAEVSGAYRLEIYPVDRRPENGVSLRLDAPPIAGAVDRAGDVDEYTIAGSAGQLLMLHLGTTGTRHGPIAVHLSDEDGRRYRTAYTGGYADNGGLNYSPRIALPHTGTYRLQVQALPDESVATGAYTLEVYTVSSAPEHVANTFAIGEVVTGERIDRPGDLDVFSFAGEAGRDVTLLLGWAQMNAQLFAGLEVGNFVLAGGLPLDGPTSGRIRLRDSTYTLTVDSHANVQSHMTHSQGAYEFGLFRIDPRPEGRGSEYVVGDTVSNEVLYPAGDIDDYSFELTEAATFEILWDAPFTTPSDAVLAHLSAEGTGEVVWNNLENFNGEPVRRVSLPRGRYRISIFNPSGRHDSMTVTLRYRFAVVRLLP